MLLLWWSREGIAPSDLFAGVLDAPMKCTVTLKNGSAVLRYYRETTQHWTLPGFDCCSITFDSHATVQRPVDVRRQKLTRSLSNRRRMVAVQLNASAWILGSLSLRPLLLEISVISEMHRRHREVVRWWMSLAKTTHLSCVKIASNSIQNRICSRTEVESQL